MNSLTSLLCSPFMFVLWVNCSLYVSESKFFVYHVNYVIKPKKQKLTDPLTAIYYTVHILNLQDYVFGTFN